ncbi:hypothetical protein BGW38_002975 [Lunasporangiospora selenospora]|uniref:Uncharacterized protein n=1 Tax=Lunasporangiospora selenospora TaxID=979761 RepID=A0A9P6G302_9FUNG|nr:hypothetical protein BGW38_002975 [Lunasporangiospora selenospora]
MSKATIRRRAIEILYDFQRARKVWGDLVSDGLTQANALVNVQLQQGAQYAKMKLQTSQFEYMMEEAIETFGEAFTYRDPLGATCTLEQIWIQLERIMTLYTLQIGLNREVVSQLVAQNSVCHRQDPQHLVRDTTVRRSDSSKADSESLVISGTSGSGANPTFVGTGQQDSEVVDDVRKIIRAPALRRDKDQGMILLSTWLNQPHLKQDTLLTFDEFCQIEVFSDDQ